ncbi:MAG: cation:H+ antiporter [Myxococcota bacterium]|jgi:cation:H+ antiporter
MMTNLLITFGGMALLVFGGDLMVRGASALAKSLGISPLAVGLTVVAFGTSAPELAVSIGAALNGSSTLAFGNIFGSNLANIGLIIGLSALIRPLPIDGAVTRRELPMMILAVAAATIMANDAHLDGEALMYSRSDGLILLLFFVVFMYYTVGDLIAQRTATHRHAGGRYPDASTVYPAESTSAQLDAGATDKGTKTIDTPGFDTDGKADDQRKSKRHVLEILIGLGALLLGAHFTVDGGIAIARAMGISEVIIGLTMISIGTSLPELVATLSAVRRGELAIAVGGVVGSNIFNILLVCGLTSTILPITIPPLGPTDLAFTGLLSLALLLTARTHSRLILRWEGAGLLVSYLAYMVWRTLPPSA